MTSASGLQGEPRCTRLRAVWLTRGAVQEDRTCAAPQSGEERREAQWQQHGLQGHMPASATVSFQLRHGPPARRITWHLHSDHASWQGLWGGLQASDETHRGWQLRPYRLKALAPHEAAA